MDTELLIIDAHAMAYRAYFALQGQNITHPATGQPTAAIFGFCRMFFRVLLDYKPPMVAVTWDPPDKSFRAEIFAEYKANRKPMPDDLRSQIEEIKNLLTKSGFNLLVIPNYEADDVMGSLCQRFGKKKQVTLLTGDKDCYQLLGKKVQMYRPSRGVTEFTRIDPEWVQNELGIGINQVTDYMGLVGDTSDNIPGARGIGPKGALELLQEYKNVETIYKNLPNISNKSLRNKLAQSRENVILSKQLATIDCEMQEIVELDESLLHTPNFLTDEVLQLFRHAGYNQIYADLRKAQDTNTDWLKQTNGAQKSEQKSVETEPKEKEKKVRYELIDSLPALTKLVEKLEKAKVLAVDTETDNTDPMQATLAGISLAMKSGAAYYIALPPRTSPYYAQGLDLDKARPKLKKLLGNKNIPKIGQNIKYDFIVLLRHDIELKGITFDTMIASYLCNPNLRRHNLDDMALDLLGHETIKYEEVVGSGRNKLTMDLVEPARIRDYACEDADITLRLYDVLKKQLKKQGLESVNEEIETKVIPVLADMEMAGVTIDRPYFRKLSGGYARKLKGFEEKIFKAAGYGFNINSTKELQKLLFEDFNLPRGRKTKTGYSTDQSVLEGLRGAHPIMDHLLGHRKYSKLRSTYVDALPALIHPETGRIHTSFNQTIAATGRLSSTEPNLQNIPIREETGRAIRRGFIAREGCELLSLDYSQIELRIMAHFSDDPGLLEVFRKDSMDVHARTAASLFDVSEDKVTPDMRSAAKVVNFSIIYGVTEFGLSKNLSISREEARAYIKRFFESYPGVKSYMDETVAFAEKNGYVVTLTGRKRQIAEIKSSNHFRREGAQRMAINTPIQGTGSDIIKLAMIQIQGDLLKKKLESKMILQVHDELLFDVFPKEKDDVLGIARSRMEKAMKLKVPLRVDYSFGKNWDEAH